MPLFNEADGITDTIGVVRQALESSFDVLLIIQDDCSTDASRAILDEIVQTDNFKISIESNLKNSGHGPTLVRAYQRAVQSNPEFVMQLDSDGQFCREDIENLLKGLLTGTSAFVVGCRKNRRDPWFRRATTKASRFLVFLLSCRLKLDPNSPIRGFNQSILKEVLPQVPELSLVPNIQLTLLILKRNVNFATFDVIHRERRGNSPTGTMWGSGSQIRKMLKFFRFSLRALIEILTTQFIRLGKGNN